MRAVVITGTSTGIGRASALALDRLGFQVFAGVRRQADGDSLRSAASPRLTPIHLDVTDDATIAAAGSLVRKSIHDTGVDGLAGLVNNAGTTVPCPVEYLPLDAFRRQLELHLTGPLALTKTFLPLLKAGRGRIVNVTSVGGRVGVPFMAPYAAGKHGLEGMSDVLRLELRALGVQVCVIEPGSVSTTMRHKLERDTKEWLDALPEDGRKRYGRALRSMATSVSRHAAHGSSPDVVARAVVHALTSRRPRTRYPVAAGARRLLFMRRVLPDRVFDRMVLRTVGIRSG
jgi:NAD(P)-dependent dehydrogenase (short-subunit alcohol dehydrogenase family)